MSTPADERFMARAVRVAENGRYTAHPNPCVGCVLAKDGEFIAEGFHLQAGHAHAEAAALSAAGSKSRHATAYVTLEPCSFQGRTPSCASALIEAGVSRVVVASVDPDARNAGKGLAMLEEAGIEVETGLLQASARALNPGHVKRHTEGMPWVRLKLAMSLDGKTALANGESHWITSAAARADVQHLRAMSGAIVTGVQTVIDDDPGLSVRVDDFEHPRAALAASISRPVYVLDSNLRIPAGAALLRQENTVVVGVAGERQLPVETLMLPDLDGRVDLRVLLETLAGREHSEVLFECGATLAGAMIEASLVDELIVYLAPRVIGDRGRSLLNMAEVVRMSGLTDLAIRDVRQIGSDVRITAIPAGAPT